MEIRSRKEAKRENLPRYFTGKPCKSGHVAERRTSGGTCISCVREWASNNTEKIRSFTRGWQKRNAERSLVAARVWRENNKGKVAIYKLKWLVNNMPQVMAYDQARKGKNREARLQAGRQWRLNNTAITKINKISRRAAHKVSMPPWADKDDMNCMYIEARYFGMHVDHIIPINGPKIQSLNGPNSFPPRMFVGPVFRIVYGLHCHTNLRIVSSSVNLRKSNRRWPDMPVYNLERE